MQEYLRELVLRARELSAHGRVATYIPALSKASPQWVAITVAEAQGTSHSAGDVDQIFTLQSISKVFALLYALESLGRAKVFSNIGYEPSGHPFYSLVQLEYEQGHPRNPLINAGAIVVSGLLPGATVAEKVAGYLGFLSAISGYNFEIDQEVYRSESQTGFRNRAVANFMKNFNVVDSDPDVAVETYFQQCSTSINVRQLADLGLILACRGRHPRTGFTVSQEHVSIVNALMSSCGLYDEAGYFAVQVGIPGKSGVSGGLLAIAPGKYAFATFGPALNDKGNSLAGLFMLTQLSPRLGVNLYF